MLERLKRLVNAEPDLTWLGSDTRPFSLPAEQRTARDHRRHFRVEVNAELLVGCAIVLGLFLVVLFGPILAPANPYLSGQSSSMTIDGEYVTAPFPPMPGLPLGSDQWGRDILSMLLYGTRNTLVACLFIAMARVLLGTTLGMLAGWNQGGLIDRAVMSLIEVTTALPALLVGMILIFALGIQGGIVTFIIALCFVGWAEIAQYIRSEFMVVRRKPFIEGARVIGLDGLGIAIRHILPNVLPSLVIVAVLEMGAVLMILGELGFIGVFIGGGTWIQVGDTEVANIPDIPEWGAMMVSARQFARSKTWMVFYPALAFFLAVLGFNLVGEGLRRIVQRRGVRTAFILSKRMGVAVLAITVATVYIVTHVGPAPSYAGLAQRFDSQQAMSHLATLAAPQMEGRQAGQPGADAAAAYIAGRFSEYGLETLNPGLDFRLPWTAQVVSLAEQPELDLLDENGMLIRSFRHRLDFGVDITGHGGSGTVEAPLAVIGFSKTSFEPEDFEGLDLRGHVVLYAGQAAPPDFAVEAQLRGARGILVIDSDSEPRLQLAYEDQDYLRSPVLPIMRITADTAEALLGPGAPKASDLMSGAEHAPSSVRGWTMSALRQRVRMKAVLSPPQEIQTDNVVGILRGSDAQLNKQLVVVGTHYDGPGREPDGRVFQSANGSASGISVMLEILRLWTSSGFQPRRTMLFAAWSGGAWVHSGADEYLQNQAVYSVWETVAVVNLDGLARGGADLLAGGDAQLVDLLLRAASVSGVPGTQGDARSYHYQTAFSAPQVTVGWSDDSVLSSEDSLARVSVSKLAKAGQAVNLALITLAREYSY